MDFSQEASFLGHRVPCRIVRQKLFHHDMEASPCHSPEFFLACFGRHPRVTTPSLEYHINPRMHNATHLLIFFCFAHSRQLPKLCRVSAEVLQQVVAIERWLQMRCRPLKVAAPAASDQTRLSTLLRMRRATNTLLYETIQKGDDAPRCCKYPRKVAVFISFRRASSLILSSCGLCHVSRSVLTLCRRASFRERYALRRRLARYLIA